MLPSTNSRSQTEERLGTEGERGTKITCANEPEAATVLACIFLLPQDAAPVFEALRKLTSNMIFQHPITFPVEDRPISPPEAEDSWLEHSVAACYLGISKSTLYHYAEQERIESRKLANRLQYRRSSLDKFKDQHVRPARRSLRARGIIPSAPNSGK